jgi:hypothetical protein
MGFLPLEIKIDQNAVIKISYKMIDSTSTTNYKPLLCGYLSSVAADFLNVGPLRY